MQGVYVLPAAGASSGPFHHADTACWIVLPLTCGAKQKGDRTSHVSRSLTHDCSTGGTRINSNFDARV
jgi:hypothetical protein